MCYRDGFGVEKSAVEMVHYLKLAASQGHADATYALALCHRDGMGTAKDTVVARYFLQLSVDRGNTDAQDLLQALSP